MILYLLDGTGVFSEESTTLPASLIMMPSPKEVLLDGKPVTRFGQRCAIPDTLEAGMHTLIADGRVVTFRVREGQLCATPLDWRCLLPMLARFSYLEKRVDALEQRIKENEVDWLK